MLTDVDKANERARLWGYCVFGMTMGIWDMVEEASAAITPVVGAQLLGLLEKQLGLEIAGEKPEEVLTELSRIFIDEFKYASSAVVEREGNKIKVSMEDVVGGPEFLLLESRDIHATFNQPYYAAGLAALNRMGYRVRGNATGNKTSTGTEYFITYELI
jgi:hypothetical protein